MGIQAKILVVDDEPVNRLILTKSLTKAGYRVIAASDGFEAIDLAGKHHPDLILLDVMMPGRDGLEVCAILRQRASTRDIPVIFVTAGSSSDGIVKAFGVGGCDFITKPFIAEEILARISVHVRLHRAEKELLARNAQLLTMTEKLASDKNLLSHQLRIDPLTKLLNRGAWDEGGTQEHERSLRHDHEYGILLIDIDHFKELNDSLGHLAGDDCLRRIARQIAAACRSYDVVGRYGGEEFVVLSPESNCQDSVNLAHRIRQGIWDLAVRHPSSPVADRVTATIGVAISRGDPLEEVLQRADDAMYLGKEKGRNCTRLDAASSQESDVDIVKDPISTVAHDEASGESKERVLVVDDCPTNRKIFERSLAREGFEVSQASDGVEALAEVERQAPDVIIMDVVMPKMGGLECTRRLKEHLATKYTPIIIASAKGDEENIRAGLGAGADEYLIKPVRPAELVLRVRSMLRLRHEHLDLVQSYRLRGEQNRSLSLILEFCRAVGTATKLDEVYQAAVAVSSKVAKSARVSIMVADTSRDYLSIACSKGIAQNLARAVKVPSKQGVAGRVYSTGRSVVINSSTSDTHLVQLYDSPIFASLPLASTPLEANSETIGVLNVTDRQDARPFEPFELEYLDLIANITGTVLHAISTRRGRDEARDSIMIALAKLAEHRDSDTGKHVDRVTQYCLILANQLKTTKEHHHTVTDAFLKDFERAVPLHDIGKVAIPDSILLKPGRLNDEEMAVMRTHAQIGAETIQSVIDRAPGTTFLEMAAEITHSHHEWFDGAGYPLGIRGAAIPLTARIAALADVYDALTTSRTYKDADSHEKSMAIILEGSGTQFDPAIVEAFVEREKEFSELAKSLADEPAIDLDVPAEAKTTAP